MFTVPVLSKASALAVPPLVTLKAPTVRVPVFWKIAVELLLKLRLPLNEPALLAVLSVPRVRFSVPEEVKAMPDAMENVLSAPVRVDVPPVREKTPEPVQFRAPLVLRVAPTADCNPPPFERATESVLSEAAVPLVFDSRT
jgi:hypothetical protein